MAPRRQLISLGAVLCIGLAGGWWFGHRSGAISGAGSARVLTPASIQAIVRRAGPAVVRLDVTTPRRPVRGRFRFSQDPQPLRPPVARVEHSLGSGVIVDPRGYIVTNRHVVHRASIIEVTLPGSDAVAAQPPYFATLVGEDAETDLAVIKINAGRTLPPAQFDDSGRLGVGDPVVAIGSPFGLDDSVTSGMVSAVARNDPDQQFETYIQTDTPINPGNSGGPLLDLDGNVVGINTSIYTESDGYQGVSFALPSHLVSAVVLQLERQGHVTRGSMGVYFESALSSAVRRVYRIPRGVPISDVLASGPAQHAGLRPGDVITSLNGDAVADAAALTQAVEFYPIGHTLRVGYERDGAAHTASLTVADRAQLYPTPAPPRAAAPAPLPADLGMNLGATSHGLTVASVVPDSFADSIGVEQDDQLVSINRISVPDRGALERILGQIRPGQDVALLVLRPNTDNTTGHWLLGGTLPPLPPAPAATSHP